jgi:serine O-acetyltransferase
MKAYREDPALRGKPLAAIELFTYAGLWAIIFHRVAHILFSMKIPLIPRVLSQIARFFTGIEIHPGARIGRGFFIDHGHGVVIGETAEIGDDVLLFHQVTLGNSSVTSAGKRHPTIGSHVVIGAGAKILGPIYVADYSQIGAGSIVTKEIPSHAVVVGNPARVIKRFGVSVSVPGCQSISS